MRRIAMVLPVVILMFACIAVEAFCQPKTEAPRRVQLKKTEPRTVASMKHKGPYTEMQTVIGRLVTEMDKGGYNMAGPIMCAFFNSPDQVAQKDLSWEILIPVAYPGPMSKGVEDKMTFRYIDPMYVGYMYHIGPYETIGDTYKIVFDWASQNQQIKSGPPVEVYWNNPQTTPKEKLVTEIWLPVEEKPTGIRSK